MSLHFFQHFVLVGLKESWYYGIGIILNKKVGWNGKYIPWMDSLTSHILTRTIFPLQCIPPLLQLKICKTDAGGWVESSRPPKIGQKCIPQKTRKQLNQPNLRFYFIIWTKKSLWSNFVIWWDIIYSMIVQMPNNLVGANVMVWKLRRFTFRFQGLFDA